MDNERKDVCEPLNTLPNHLLLLKAERRDLAYILDYRNVAEPRSIVLNIQRIEEASRFNLYSAIIPSNDNFRDR